ncbi:MAG: hypothetical protein V4507_05930 [Verrucomicrobiota bacterium]
MSDSPIIPVRLPSTVEEYLKVFEDFISEFEKGIGSPDWKDFTMEYDKVMLKHLVFLKLVKMTSFYNAAFLLARNGFVTECYNLLRSAIECVLAIHFVIEKYPNTTDAVGRYLGHFRSTSLLEPERAAKADSVQIKTILEAYARGLAPNEQEADKSIKKIYDVFSGYVHANYPHIMEIYGGKNGNWKFHTQGVAGIEKREECQMMLKEILQFGWMAFAFSSRKLSVSKVIELTILSPEEQ